FDADWDITKQNGFYEHPSLKEEGFIHCSQEHQLSGVLERYFTGAKDLVKLVIDTEKLTSKLVYDWSPTVQDTFPHIYGVINLDAVVEIISL
ncbi:MAG TPA: DUF952 domain-containing protein, partial [Chitinophagaceae bacterium]|nr:DUF952 domain-containing protein [Chitinophagaceae bacterium]